MALSPTSSRGSSGGGGSISVTDGTTTVNPATELDLTAGSVVTDAGGGVAQVATAARLAPTAVRTANYTAVAGDLVVCDSSGGAFTVTLPSAPADKTVISVVVKNAGNTVTVARGGADTLNGALTSVPVSAANQSVVLQYQASAGTWWLTVAPPVPAGIATAKGDLVVATGAGLVSRLGVGADTLVLTADSSQAGGLKWAAGGGGGTVINNPSMGVAVVGQYYLSSGLAVSGTATFGPGNGGMICGTPIELPYAITIDKLGCYVNGTAGGTGSVTRLGIYQITTSDPWAIPIGGTYGTLLVDAGTVVSTSTGAKTVTLGSPQVIAAYTPFVVAVVPQGAPTPDPTFFGEAATTYAGGTPWGANGASFAAGVNFAFKVTGVTGALPGTLTPTAFNTPNNGALGFFHRSA